MRFCAEWCLQENYTLAHVQGLLDPDLSNLNKGKVPALIIRLVTLYCRRPDLYSVRNFTSKK